MIFKILVDNIIMTDFNVEGMSFNAQCAELSDIVGPECYGNYQVGGGKRRKR